MTRWAWMDIYGNLNEALMGILWLFPSNNVSLRLGVWPPLVKAAGLYLLCTDVSYCCSCFGVVSWKGVSLCKNIFGSSSQAVLCAVICVCACMLYQCVQIIGKSKWCVFACIHIEEPQHHGNVHVQILALQLHTTILYDTEFLIKGISPATRVTATLQWEERQYFKIANVQFYDSLSSSGSFVVSKVRVHLT